MFKCWYYGWLSSYLFFTIWCPFLSQVQVFHFNYGRWSNDFLMILQTQFNIYLPYNYSWSVCLLNICPLSMHGITSHGEVSFGIQQHPFRCHSLCKKLMPTSHLLLQVHAIEKSCRSLSVAPILCLIVGTDLCHKLGTYP